MLIDWNPRELQSILKIYLLSFWNPKGSESKELRSLWGSVGWLKWRRKEHLATWESLKMWLDSSEGLMSAFSTPILCEVGKESADFVFLILAPVVLNGRKRGWMVGRVFNCLFLNNTLILYTEKGGLHFCNWFWKALPTFVLFLESQEKWVKRMDKLMRILWEGWSEGRKEQLVRRWL